MLTRTNLLSVAGLLFFLLLAFGSTDTKTKTNSTAGGGSSGGASSSGAGVSSSEDPKAVALRDVSLDFKGSKVGFGNVMEADFTITNPTPYRVKDLEVECVHYAPSGTEIDSNTRTIYETVEPKGKKVVKKFNMGFINSQAVRSSCKIKDLTVVQ